MCLLSKCFYSIFFSINTLINIVILSSMLAHSTTLLLYFYHHFLCMLVLYSPISSHVTVLFSVFLSPISLCLECIYMARVTLPNLSHVHLFRYHQYIYLSQLWIPLVLEEKDHVESIFLQDFVIFCAFTLFNLPIVSPTLFGIWIPALQIIK